MTLFDLPAFSDKQLKYFSEATAFVNIAEGSVRSGKTHTSLHLLIYHALFGPPGLMVIMGKTKDTVERNVIEPLKELFPIRYIKGSHLFIGDRRLDIIGANDKEAESKVRGLTAAGAYLNEVTLYPKNVFDQVIARCSVDGAKIFGDTNPDGPFHWLKKDYFDQHGLGSEYLKRFSFILDDNETLSERYKDALKALYAASPLWYQRMILGKWVAAEGAIYDMFDASLGGPHVEEFLPLTFDKMAVGIDYGTSSVTTFLAAGRNNGKWWIFREYYYDARQTMRQKSNDEFAEDFLDFLDGKDPLSGGQTYPDRLGSIQPSTIEIDPSASGLKVNLRRRGIQQLRNADNDVIEGIRNVQDAFAANDLKIMRWCQMTQEEHSGYVWDPDKQAIGEDAPVKENDHTCDTVRYILKRHYGRPELRVLPGRAG